MAQTQAQTHSGFLHSIPRPGPQPLVAFEHFTHHANQKSTIIFLGGLGDGLLTVPYTAILAALLPSHWRIVEPILSSSYRQWGISTLNDDVVEIAILVRYFRAMGGKVVLMGHSTGCQMIMHYLSSPLKDREEERPRINGAILQGSVSDREGIVDMLDAKEYNELNRLAKGYVEKGMADEALPISKTKFMMMAPINAERWLALASPPPDHSGDDDYFSSDLSDERLQQTFGAVGRSKVRFAFIFGDKDQHVPLSVDKQAMVNRWEDIIRKAGGTVDQSSGLLHGGSHTMKEGGAIVEEMVQRVKGLLNRLEEMTGDD